MIVNRPSIYIYVNQPDQAVLREICSGIEEEGVFYEVTEQQERELDSLAWSAANESMLGSGIGISGSSAALIIRGLKQGQNILSYVQPSAHESRMLGANSARVIKKQPLKGI